jgi:hypothetical protein
MVNPFSPDPNLNSYQRQTHTYIIGQPGTGKSRLMESWILQDIQKGHGICMIDPHGDLFQSILGKVAEMPLVWDRVVIIDPCDTRWAISLNPLQASPESSPERTAWFLADIILKIWKLKPNDAPRMTWLMANTFAALADLNLPINATGRFLMDKDYRSTYIPRIHSHTTRAYFELEFPKSDNAAHQWATPLLNKLGSFLHDPDIAAMFSSPTGLNFRDLMDRRCIILVHIPKGILGENTSNLLGAFIVAQIQQSALSRSSSSMRHPYYLYLDEFQNYTTDNIADILSEARKYALSMVLAHQYLDQLEGSIQAAVLNTSGILAAFRIGYDDALQLCKHVFPNKDFASPARFRINIHQFSSLLIPAIEEEKRTGNWDQLAQLISNQKNREFWVHNRATRKPVHLRSHDVPHVPLTRLIHSHVRELVDNSGRRYARLKRSQGESNNANYQAKTNQSGDMSFWSR